MIINVSIRRKKASSPAARIVCGNTDYQIAFTFDSEWDAYETKTARFIWNGQYADVVFTGNVCDVPKITDTTLCMVGVFAGDLHTTTPAYIKCDRSILCGDGSPAAPAEDVYAQIMELLNSGGSGGGGGLPSGGGPNQVLTTDADGNAGWEDKPFYAEKGNAVKEGLSLAGDGGEIYITEVIPVEIGKTYIVNWNGAEYTCAAGSVDMDGVTCATLGDITDGSTAPFGLLFFDADTAAAMGVGGAAMAWDGSSTATLSIYNANVHTLNQVYLPRMLVNFTVVDVTRTQYNVAADKTFDEVKAALDAGWDVIGVLDLTESVERIPVLRYNENNIIFAADVISDFLVASDYNVSWVVARRALKYNRTTNPGFEDSPVTMGTANLS